MQSSMISKIQKAHQYAEEPSRVQFAEFKATFRGDHDSYDVTLQGDHWRCSCNFFPGWGVCSHIMAIQKLIGPMLPSEAMHSTAPDPAAV
jgi:hypothetical protein